MHACMHANIHMYVLTPNDDLKSQRLSARTSINKIHILLHESMVSLVLRQYMRGENGTESLVGCFFLSCLFE